MSGNNSLKKIAIGTRSRKREQYYYY